jgi:hypothetical protein
MKALPLLVFGLSALVAIDAAQAASAAKPAKAASAAKPASSASAAKPAPAPAFDRPEKFFHQPLGAGSAKTPKLGTSCFYFSHFMVKQIDTGEEGADQLSILPIAAPAKPLPCQRKNLPGELVIPSDQWSGYFKGVKGNFVLLDAADGSNGGVGFAVFAAATGKKLFEDSAVGTVTPVTVDGGTLKLRYTRAFPGSCSVPIDGEACWGIIAAAAGLPRNKAPDCVAAYKQGMAELAKERCKAKIHAEAGCFETELKGVEDQHFDQSPSVVEYQVEADIDSAQQSVLAQPGPVSCQAAD